MSIRILFMALIVCYCGSMSGATQLGSGSGRLSSSGYGSVEGRVRSAGDRPLADVRIELLSLLYGTTLVTSSNSAGVFKLELSKGDYLVTATLGTQTATNQVRVGPGQSWVDLRMPGKDSLRVDSQSTISSAQLRVPEKARNALQKAHDAATKKNAADAARYVDKALQLYPLYAKALVMRAVLERDKDPETALVDAMKAVEYDPNDGMGYVVLGSVYTALSRFDEAVRSLDHGIALMPSSWQGYYEMSRALAGKRDYIEALRHLERACSLAPKSYPFFHLSKAAIFDGLSISSAAVTELQAYLREDPNGEKAVEAKRMLDKLQATTANK
jgi:tetratricopeptide (TPR) repeat protein